ncbi:MAG: phosphotransferase family protein [Candidatus Dormibacteria bacterium]
MAYTDTYSQPDAPDPVLSEDRVLELARAHSPSVRRLTAVDESGGEARAYMCDEDVVVKTQRPPQLRPRTSLEKEAFILAHIAEQVSVPVPRVLGYGREEDVEYLVMTRIPGMALEQVSLAPPARVAVLEALGATLRMIHQIDQSAMVSSGLIPGDSSAEDMRQRLTAGFEDSIASLRPDPRWAEEIDLTAVAERCLAELPAETSTVTLHSNPGPEHCFVDPDRSTFTGLIDFGDAYRSHPALDVRSWFSLDDSRHMLAGYRSLGPLPEDFDAVWRAGLLLTELRLAARGYREPGAVARTISELLPI